MYRVFYSVSQLRDMDFVEEFTSESKANMAAVQFMLSDWHFNATVVKVNNIKTKEKELCLSI